MFCHNNYRFNSTLLSLYPPLGKHILSADAVKDLQNCLSLACPFVPSPTFNILPNKLSPNIQILLRRNPILGRYLEVKNRYFML